MELSESPPAQRMRICMTLSRSKVRALMAYLPHFTEERPGQTNT
jgi:hypothetical protein